MKKVITIIIIILFFGIVYVSCTSKTKYSKDKPRYSKPIGNNLYEEIYEIYAGDAFTEESYSIYITDSVHFRKFIGILSYVGEEIFYLKDGQDMIFYCKQEKFIGDGYDTVKIGKYNIEQLINQGKFE